MPHDPPRRPPKTWFYCFARITPGGAEVTDAGGKLHVVSGCLACIDGRCAVRARWLASRNGLHHVRFACGAAIWVAQESEYQLETAA
jgi:hypothetical protein